MHSDLTTRLRRALQRTDHLTSGDRYVDFGVQVWVVEQDDEGDVLIPSTPKCAAMPEHTWVDEVGTLRTKYEFGGMYDTVMHEWTGPSERPTVWYASEVQAKIALHGPELPEKILAYGAMGSGKTEGALSMWALLRALELAGQGRRYEGGLTAPTMDRAALILTALIKRCPPEWYSWRAKDKLFELKCGIGLRLATTTVHSEEVGSPIQGWNWAFHAGDELQDQTDQLDNILARGRTAPGGVYRQLGTATAKDSPKWRTARDKLKTAKMPDGTPVWSVIRMEGWTNPFVPVSFWAKMKAQLDPRTYQRIVLAMDVGPELACYPHWRRDHHLRTVPIMAKDVTRQVLMRHGWGPNLDLLCGHDPGTLQDVTVMLKAFALPKRYMLAEGLKPSPYVWFVVDELTTDMTSTEVHIRKLKARLQAKWGLHQVDWNNRELPDSPRALILIDPYGDSDNKTDKTVKDWFQLKNLVALNAASGRAGRKHGRIPRDPGIKMVDRLISVDRLFVDCDERRGPAAEKCVEAIELNEREQVTGEAEKKRRDRPDLSHWVAAIRYALWLLEKHPLDIDESYVKAIAHG